MVLTRPMLEALEGTAFALEQPDEVKLAKHGLHYGQIHTEAGELLLQSLRQIENDGRLVWNSRRALRGRIESVEAQLAAGRSFDRDVGDSYEWIKGQGEVALEILGDYAEGYLPRLVSEVERWGEFDPDVRERVRALRDALAGFQEAVWA